MDPKDEATDNEAVLQTAVWEREQFRSLAQLEAKRLQQLKVRLMYINSL